MSYDILYYFESEKIDIFEIKRHIRSEDKSKVYFWILYSKSLQKIERLEFQAMSETSRTFIQGQLELNSNSALFIASGGKVRLIKRDKSKLDAQVDQKLESDIFI